MSTTITRRTATPPRERLPQQAERRRLAVHVRDVPEALIRVLSVLQRRRCRITSVDFAAADRHRPGRLIVSVAAPPAHAHCVVPWVESLVDVLAVERLDE
jgi:acetolactate synthase regulatory subunit